jgi:hypothetical protein
MSSMMFLKFQMCFPRVFPIAPHLYPIHFAQSSSLLTCIPGPKGRHYISDRNFYFGKLLKLFLIKMSSFFTMGQSKLLIAKKKKVGHFGGNPPSYIGTNNRYLLANS